MAPYFGLLVSAFAGILSHVCYFLRGEHHLHAPIIARVYIALFLGLSLLEWNLHDGNARAALLSTFAILGGYLISLFGSLSIYRLYFHRLAPFPGPALARLTKFYHLHHVRGSDQYLFLERLHQKYGDYVRTGPNEVTIFTPEAIPAILGSGTSCGKSPWWDMMSPEVSMVTTRSKNMHAVRRRTWEGAFSVKALQDLEPRVYAYVQRLESILARFCNSSTPVNITQFFEYYTFDVMGDVNFGVSFGMLKTEKPDPAVAIFKQGMKLFGPATPVPWLHRIAASIPGLQGGWHAYRGWADSKLREKIEANKEEKRERNSISYVIENTPDELGPDYRYRWLLGDFITLMSAATEPVLCTLVFLFYHLALSPTHMKLLRQDLASVIDLSDHRVLATLPYLTALINETLRLHPPVPSGGLRDTPPEGILTGQTWVPGDTTVLIPQYSLGRREDCYERPNEFLPERWMERGDLIKDRNAFIPFGFGNHTCLGRNLALMEVRLATALLVVKYDIELAEGEDGIDVERKMEDLFVATPGPLKLMFRERKIEGKYPE